MQDIGRLEDDPEMVRVALAMIDALDEDEVYLPTPTAAPCIASDGGMLLLPEKENNPEALELLDVNEQQKRRRVPHRRKNPKLHQIVPTGTGTGTGAKKTTRDREREEMVYLRDKMKELEATLATLKEDIRRRHAVAAPGPLAAEISQAWAEITTRQQCQRRHAELENAKLRATLRSQLHTGKSLMRLFQRAMNKNENVQQPPMFSIPAEPTLLSSSSRDLDQQLANLDVLYHRRERMFTARQFNDGSLNFRDIHLHSNRSETELGADFLVGWVLPFPLRDVLEAVWQATLTRVHSKECMMEEFKHLAAPPKTVIAQYRGNSITKEPMFQGPISGVAMMKHFYDPSSNEGVVVSLWDGALSKGDTKTIFIEEFISRIHHISGGPEDGATRVQTCRRLHVRAATGATIPRRQAGLITNVLMTEVERDTIAKQQMIENLLLRRRGAVKIVE